MKKILTKFFIWTAVLVLLPTAALLIVSYVYGDTVTNKIISELNKDLKGTIRVQNTSFSLIEKFPYASIEFHNVLALSSDNFNRKDHPVNTDTAIVARSIFIQFNILKLLRKEYSLHKISLENARLNVFIDKAGENNLQFYQPKEDGSKSKVDVEIKSLSLKNVKCTYWSTKDNMLAQAVIENMHFAGNFEENNTEITSDASFNCYRFRYENEEYIRNKDFSYTANIQLRDDAITVRSLHLEQKDIELNLEGIIKNSEKGKDLTLELECNDSPLAALLGFVPMKQYKQFSQYAPKGNITFNAEIEGRIAEGILPSLEASYQLSDGAMLYKGQTVFAALNGKITCTALDKPASYKLEAENLAVRYKNSLVAGALVLKNFERLDVNTKLSAHLNAGELVKLFQLDTSLFADGIVKGDIKCIGQFNDFSLKKFDDLIIDAKLQAEKLNIGIKDNDLLRFEAINGGVEIKNSSIFLDGVLFSNNRANMKLSGHVLNLPAYIADNKSKLNLDLDLFADTLNTALFMQKEDNNATDESFYIPRNIRLKSKVTLNRLLYDNMQLDNIRTRFSYDGDAVTLDDIKSDVFNGAVTGRLILKQRVAGDYTLSCEANLITISLPQLFEGLDNFDQDFITSKHLKGNVSAGISFKCAVSKKFELDRSSIFAQADLVVKNGALLNFEPAMELSQFVELSELQNITFSNLENYIVIRNDSIMIPRMDINSNAFNIALAGTQDFNSEFDYHLELLLNEILSKKRKQKTVDEEDFGEVEDDGLGRTKLFLRIKGNPDDYKVSWDKKKVRDVRREKVQQERTVLRQMLREEFNIGKKDSTVQESVKREPEPADDFDFEFDDM